MGATVETGKHIHLVQATKNTTLGHAYVITTLTNPSLCLFPPKVVVMVPNPRIVMVLIFGTLGTPYGTSYQIG